MRFQGMNWVQDKVSGLWKSLKPEELEEAKEATPNREVIRRYRWSLRRKGAGYTRRMRKGREQRVVEGLRLITHQPSKTERDRYGRVPRRHPHRQKKVRRDTRP